MTRVLYSEFVFNRFTAMLKDCPHCYARVIPMNGSLCPNCNKDLYATIEQEIVPVWIGYTTILPPKCHRCGVSTSRTDKIIGWTRDTVYVENEESDFRIALFFLSLMFLPFVILLSRFTGKKNVDSKYVIEIPTCELCRAKDTEILEHNNTRTAIKIAVHREFARNLRS